MDKTKSGEPIYRYQPKETRELVIPSFVKTNEMKKIEKHIEDNVGKIDFVYHEVVSTRIHLDVQVIPPRPNYDFYTLVTVGMSALPMNTPKGSEKFRFAELIINLPKSWKIDKESLKDYKYYWPIHGLKWLASFVHEYSTWLGVGHSVPNGDPPAVFHESVNFTGFVLLPSIQFKNVNICNISLFKKIYFYTLHPLYTDEMNYKLDNGIVKLIDKLDEYKISEVIDAERKSII